jgi:DNA-directed RNA polymerase subunit RPC12/RpoP
VASNDETKKNNGGSAREPLSAYLKGYSLWASMPSTTSFQSLGRNAKPNVDFESLPVVYRCVRCKRPYTRTETKNFLYCVCGEDFYAPKLTDERFVSGRPARKEIYVKFRMKSPSDRSGTWFCPT